MILNIAMHQLHWNTDQTLNSHMPPHIIASGWAMGCLLYYSDVIMGAIASQITNLTIVYSTVLFRHRSKKTSKLCVTGLCVGNSRMTSEFPAQMASNTENVPFDDVIMCEYLRKLTVCNGDGHLEKTQNFNPRGHDDYDHPQKTWSEVIHVDLEVQSDWTHRYTRDKLISRPSSPSPLPSSD